ncbi:MAG: NUDIX domain-containing protein [Parachlamydiales bacterium]|nr:NUDIX domain-containing protein [Parachlamydiales bacterium]
MQKFVVVVECAIEFNGKILFIKRPNGVHAGGLLSFPGGKVESNDGGRNINILVNAVKREILEEVGLDLIDPVRFITSSYFIDSNNVHVLDTVFYCNIENSNIEIKPSAREVPEYFWLTADQALIHDNAADWLKHYISCIEREKKITAAL